MTCLVTDLGGHQANPPGSQHVYKVCSEEIESYTGIRLLENEVKNKMSNMNPLLIICRLVLI